MQKNNQLVKILVVDDQFSDRELAKDILEHLGFIVETAESGIDAKQLLQNNSYEIVLTDLMMPQVDGIELTKFIKNYNPEIEVIIMTAYGTIETAKEAIKLGAYDYITKPIDKLKISIVIKNCVESHKLKKETKQLQQKIANMEKMATISQLSSIVAHQIRNPLFAITSTAELLKEKIASTLTTTTDEFKQLIDIILDSCNTINRFIYDMLKSTEIKISTLEKVDVKKSLQHILAILKPTLQHKKIDCQIEIPNNIYVLAEETMFQQCIMNILTNSIEAINENGIIKISVFHKNNKTIIEIIDNGEGIQQQYIEKIFEPFFTTKVKGTGLGMFFVYNVIVNIFGGEVNIESAGHGKGTKVTLSLLTATS
ncbi:MAG: hybrid sensor histidine kinase/response regulator [Endomicrobia bacterium]|nr:hybrid sensor histidine kinase/response regulator [Endomicrobiia bacterium]